MVPQFFMMPEANIEERSNEDRVPYAQWGAARLHYPDPRQHYYPGFVAQAVFRGLANTTSRPSPMTAGVSKT